MFRRTLHVSACYVLFLITFSVIVIGQSREIPLKDRSITIHMEKKPLEWVMQRLMINYDVVIGFEESILDRDHDDFRFYAPIPWDMVPSLKEYGDLYPGKVDPRGAIEAGEHPITVKFEKGKLSEVLDSIVDQMKNYKWEINDEVVNIYPQKGRDERFKALLETSIQTFQIDKNLPVKEVTRRIILLPEFNSWLNANKLFFTGARSGSKMILKGQYELKLKKSIELSGLSFRDLLNKIAKSKRGGWIIKWKSRNREGEEHIDIVI